jgi:hypothetical protein
MMLRDSDHHKMRAYAEAEKLPFAWLFQRDDCLSNSHPEAEVQIQGALPTLKVWLPQR